MDEPIESGVAYLRGLITGGIVTKSDIALKIAELLIGGYYGSAKLEQQKPLKITDQSDRWLIKGSYEKPPGVEGSGPANVVIMKYDCRVLDLSIPYILPVPPEVAEYIKSVTGKTELP
jgi:hypothetical protein